MFAPKKVARPVTKTTTSSTSKLMPDRSALVGQQLDSDPAEQGVFLQQAGENQATPEQTSRTMPGSTWDFSKIPVFAPGRLERSPLQRSAPWTLAAADAVHQATVENHTGSSPTQADLEATMDQAEMRHDASADHSARLLGAEAVAFGNQILFRSDSYEPRSERGFALIAHELTHVAHQHQTGLVRPQRSVSGDVLSVQYTREMAEAMTDDELTQQMNILRSHLQETPDDSAAAENLSVLESVAYDRQGTAQQAPASEAAPGQSTATQDEVIASMSTGDKLLKAYEYANIGPELRSQLEQRFGPQQLVVMIAAGIGVFLVAQVTPVGWIADIGMVLTAAFVAKSLFDAFHHLAGFAAAASATTDLQLHQAGDEFAKAIAGLEIDTVMLILTLLAGGGASSASAPAGELALVGADGIIIGTIPAAQAAETATAITTAQAAQLGFNGAALTNAMMSYDPSYQSGEELPEGTHKIVDDPNADETGVSSHAKDLGKALEQIGEDQPGKNYEPHHIVPWDDPRAAEARAILEEANIGIDSAENGVWLPRTSKGDTTAEAFTSHDTIHTNEYISEITTRLTQAGPDNASAVLNDIKALLMLGAM